MLQLNLALYVLFVVRADSVVVQRKVFQRDLHYNGQLLQGKRTEGRLKFQECVKLCAEDSKCRMFAHTSYNDLCYSYTLYSLRVRDDTDQLHLARSFAKEAKCPFNNLVDEMCVTVMTTEADFSQADIACKNNGQRIVTVKRQTKAVELQNFITNNGTSAGLFWVGAYTSPSRWIWKFYQSSSVYSPIDVDASLFCPNEPGIPDCIALDTTGQEPCLRTVGCESELSFICETESTI